MQNFEQLGLFYLGKQYDLDHGELADGLVLYDAKDLTTHAVCVGMTGSGKTGLCLSLLEEAAIDGIPVIAIDPKGDLGNLLLTFPQLRPADFQPWIDPSDAKRRSQTVDQYSTETAERWKSGLAEWGQDGARIERLRAAVDLAIYTPGSDSGLPISLLRSFTPPADAVVQNNEALRDRIMATVSGLLALVNLDADPIASREHILLSNILDRSWRDGKALDMGELLRAIQSPTFDKVGMMDLETFFPAAERFKLALLLNNLIASPGFAVWMQGEPLDVGRLLYTADGKPRVSIMSIAHLSDSERMFFVTLLLNEVLSWIRTQSGTSSLRAILYMDEVFGYFPPTANPPSKRPMLTLLKQARAYGLGVVLATQNPVDLDYKGLSNAGTWFLGRLQTERDKARVLEGLEGASATAGANFDRQAMETTLARLGNRVFLMHNVHDDQPVVFQSRWAMSFLRGPLTRDQITTLMKDRKAEQSSRINSETGSTFSAVAGRITDGQVGARPMLPPEIRERFVAYRGAAVANHRLVYEPTLLGLCKIHFADAKSGIDLWRSMAVLAHLGDTVGKDPWNESEIFEADEVEFDEQPQAAAKFQPVPMELLDTRGYNGWQATLKNYLYRRQSLTLFKCAKFKTDSQPGESEADFRIRISQESREQRDVEIEKLRAKYAAKAAALQELLRRAMQREEREKSQASQATFQSAISFGTTVLGALFGRKTFSASNVSKAATAAKSAGRAMQQRGDVAQANETVAAIQARLDQLNSEVQIDTDAIAAKHSPDALVIDSYELKPKKTEIAVDEVILAWIPGQMSDSGTVRRSFEL